MVEKQRLSKKPIGKCYQDIFNNSDGERVLEHICRLSDVFDTTATVDGTGKVDVEQMLLKEGARRLALSIWRQVHTKPTMEQMEQYYGQ